MAGRVIDFKGAIPPTNGTGPIPSRMEMLELRVEHLQAAIYLLGCGYTAWAKEAARLADLLIAAMNRDPADPLAQAAAHDALRAHLSMR